MVLLSELEMLGCKAFPLPVSSRAVRANRQFVPYKPADGESKFT